MRSAAFIQAARISCASPLRILCVHVLPNVADVPLVLLVIGMDGLALLSALRFLGLGVQPPEADWGGLLFERFGRSTSLPWWRSGRRCR